MSREWVMERAAKLRHLAPGKWWDQGEKENAWKTTGRHNSLQRSWMGTKNGKKVYSHTWVSLDLTFSMKRTPTKKSKEKEGLDSELLEKKLRDWTPVEDRHMG